MMMVIMVMTDDDDDDDDEEQDKMHGTRAKKIKVITENKDHQSVKHIHRNIETLTRAIGW